MSRAHADSQSKALITLLAGERSELLARKHGGENISAVEQKHLEELTARLTELLPSMSWRELEILREMTKEVKSIRERAQERRRQAFELLTGDKP